MRRALTSATEFDSASTPAATPLLMRQQSFGVCSRRVDMAGTVIRDTRLAPTIELPRHQHVEPYLCIVLEGSYTEHARTEIACGPGSIVSHPGGHVHANRTGPNGARCVNVEFSSTLLSDDTLRALTTRERQMRLPITHSTLARLHHSLMQADSTAALSTFAATIDVVCAGTTLPDVTRGGWWLRRVIEYLESDLARTPAIEELANIAGVHASHLVRSFRQSQGETVGGYLRRRRLELADVSLRLDDPSLAAIAAEFGFCDQAHFTRAYTRHFGVSPGRRRRMLRS
jgi:AraC family transcriptional regulator